MKNLYHYFTIFLFTLFVLSIQGSIQAQEKKTYNIKIKVKYTLNNPGDTLMLSFGPQAIEQRIKKSFIGVVQKDNFCSFDVVTEFAYGYISIVKTKANPQWKNDTKILANQLFWEAGDDITVDIPDNKKINDYISNTQFIGRGADKYSTLYKIREELQNYFNEIQNNAEIKIPSFIDPLIDTIPIDHERNNRLLSVLDKKKFDLSTLAYSVLKTDILMRNRQEIVEFLEGYIYKNLQDKSPAIRSQFADRLMNTFFPYPHLGTSDTNVAASLEFQKGYGTLIYLVASLRNSIPNLKNALSEIRSIGNGAKEQSIMLSVLNLVGVEENQDDLNKLRDFIKLPRFKLMLEDHQNLIRKNIAGYQFYNTSGSKIDLSSFKGKLLLIDFWFSGCGGCAYYYQNVLSKVEEELKNDPRFEVISISCDTKKEMWLKSVKNNTYSNVYCINLNTGPEGKFHPFYSYMGIFKSPFVMLVDKNGEVIVVDTPELRTNPDLLLKAINKYL